MPGYSPSNALPSFSPTGRSIDEYRITLASLLAASISFGVIAVGSGVAALRGLAKIVRPRAAEPLTISRRLILFRIVVLLCRRHCEKRSDQAIRLLVAGEVDCFASL